MYKNSNLGGAEIKDLVGVMFERRKDKDSPIAQHSYSFENYSITVSHIPALLSQISIHQKEQKQKAQLHLYLQNNLIDAKGCHHLLKAGLKNMTILILNKNWIGDGGCFHLSQGKWPLLQFLNLRENNITEKGCYYLSKGKWGGLDMLNLFDNAIGKRGYACLTDSFYGCKVMCFSFYKKEQN